MRIDTCTANNTDSNTPLVALFVNCVMLLPCGVQPRRLALSPPGRKEAIALRGLTDQPEVLT
jgi:hypothetical protein